MKTEQKSPFGKRRINYSDLFASVPSSTGAATVCTVPDFLFWQYMLEISQGIGVNDYKKLHSLNIPFDKTQHEIMSFCQAEMDKHDQENMQARLKQGVGKKCIFMIYCGEMGHRFLQHIRMVHFMEGCLEKVVCLEANSGLECLYPTATKFDYNYKNPLPDYARMGTDRCTRRDLALENAYSNYHIVQGGGLSYSEEWLLHRPDQKIPLKFKQRGYKVDIVISTRLREMLAQKNYMYCDLIAGEIIKRGLTFATLGKEPTSYHLPGEKYFSGDLEDFDATLELISNAKCFIGQDSAMVHCAALIGIPIIALQIPDTILGRKIATTRDFLTHHATTINTTSGFPTYIINKSYWTQPEKLTEQVTEILDGKIIV